MSDTQDLSLSRSEEILTVAQDLIQTRGYNGFSYRDIAAAIGIKSASIHYHFPTKGDLGRAVAARYCDRFDQALSALAADSVRDQLEGYAALFRDTLVDRGRLCLCGMLAGEVETVPAAVKVEVARFFEVQHRWLTKVIQQGINNGEIPASRDAQGWASTCLATLEGAMFVAQGCGDYAHFDVAAVNVLAALFEQAG
ncbi:MAG: TetR/AcrR family transcriptional regulator [Cyanobacteria bacterium P01_G01_bin.38]